MYQYILFDLDGTLTDPGIGITNSVMYALEKYGIELPERSALYKFIGPPLLESFEKYYGFSREQSEVAVAYFREYFKDKGIFENKPYEGIKEMLAQLKQQGKTLVLATSKPEDFAVIILKHFGFYEYFDYCAGACMDEKTRAKKSEVITYALELCGIKDKSQAIMIGDRMHDICGAAENGLDSMGVLYGYGDLEELTKAGAKYIARSPEEILKLIS